MEDQFNFNYCDHRFKGDGGIEPLHGIKAAEEERNEKPLICLYPLDETKNRSFSCYLEIPLEEMDNFIAFLTKRKEEVEISVLVDKLTNGII